MCCIDPAGLLLRADKIYSCHSCSLSSLQCGASGSKANGQSQSASCCVFFPQGSATSQRQQSDISTSSPASKLKMKQYPIAFTHWRSPDAIFHDLLASLKQQYVWDEEQARASTVQLRRTLSSRTDCCRGSHSCSCATTGSSILCGIAVRLGID